MDIAITNVHLDLGAGRRGTDMGPSAMHVAGLVPKLRQMGHRVADVADNYQRRRVHRWEPCGRIAALRVTVLATHGLDHARILEVRAYA